LAEPKGGEPVDVIRVATRSKPTAVAGAIAASVRQSNEAKVQAIGPMAVNQAMKSIAVARSYLAVDGLTIVCVPSFIEVPVDGGKRTAMRFQVEPR
jgi:stage V sporulation protein S